MVTWIYNLWFTTNRLVSAAVAVVVVFVVAVVILLQKFLIGSKCVLNKQKCELFSF